MIRVLIVDDAPEKLSKISHIVATSLQQESGGIDSATNVIDAKNLLTEKYYDLLIIDMVLPMREGGSPINRAGADLVCELPLVKSFKKPGLIIGITAYSSAYEDNKDVFQQGLWNLLQYDPASNEWEILLKSRLDYLAESRRNRGNGSGYFYDIAVVTALYEPELGAMLSVLNNVQQLVKPNDETIYYTGTLKGRTRELSIVAACARQMGMVAACTLSMKCIEGFRPRYLIMCGISGGFRSSKVGMCDVLICDESWNYDSGKRVVVNGASKFEPDPKHICIDGGLAAKLQTHVGQQAFVAEIQRDWQMTPSNQILKSHLGPVVSGSSVVMDEAISSEIKSHARTVLGLEMETYGVYYAAENCTNPKPLAVSIKSVCDYADDKKSDSHQQLAADTSAEYVKHLAASGIFE